MKFNQLFLGSAILIGILSCSKRSDFELTQELTINSSMSVMAPEGFINTPLSSHDSAFGRISDPSDTTFVLFYDIGINASSYVDLDSKDKKKGKSENASFYYEEVDKLYVNDPDCCLYITFPDHGPANFIALKNQHMDLVLEIMETFSGM